MIRYSDQLVEAAVLVRSDDYPMWATESSSPSMAIREIASLNGLEVSQLRATPYETRRSHDYHRRVH
jgi:hypothetical protein